MKGRPRRAELEAVCQVPEMAIECLKVRCKPSDNGARSRSSRSGGRPEEAPRPSSGAGRQPPGAGYSGPPALSPASARTASARTASVQTGHDAVLMPSAPVPGVRVGVDTAEVTEVAASIARFGDRYLRRIYTDGELADCEGSPVVMARGLAARFAAKEATLKVLRPSGTIPGWRTIEVRRAPGGWPELHLRGAAEQLAVEAGLGGLSVSLTHHGELATAVVVGVCQPRREQRSDDGHTDPSSAR